LFNNLSFTDFSRHGTLVEQVGFFFFLSCMMYAAVRRSIFTEREYRVILHDLETARQIQQGILPQDLPRSPAFSVAARYIPMTQVGGDFYAFHQDDDHHAGILVADVSGHGIPAALLASMIKVAFSSLADRAAHPAELLGSVNNALTGHLNHEFITTAYLWFNFSDMTMQYASAGHPAPVLVRDGKAGDSLFTARGIPLGITGEVNYRQGSVVLLPGDRIVVYTDGITETFNPRGELFGKQRFFAEIEAAGKLSGEKFVDQLIDNVISWSGRKSTDSLDDDVTLIVIDIR
jgi:serine phosphatase RsbU (regulator of sigma subunit)